MGLRLGKEGMEERKMEADVGDRKIEEQSVLSFAAFRIQFLIK